MDISLWVAMALSPLLVYLLTPWVKKLAVKAGAWDEPGERKVHRRPMPRLGGLAVYAGFIFAVLITQPLSLPVLGILVGSTLIVFLGMWDDIKGLSPKVKLAGQVLVAVIVVIFFDIKVEFITNPFGDIIGLGIWAIPFTIFWIIGITNALNLIDGLDGLAAGISAIASLTIAIVSWSQGEVMVAVLALLLMACVLGFLRYNFHPAQIFLGDGGSMFLGFNLSVLAILGLTKGATAISLFIPVVILGIPIFDTFLAIGRRFLSRQPIFKADQHHLHHRLLELGFSHRQTVLVIYGVNLCLGFSAVVLVFLATNQAVVLLLALASVTFFAANKLGMVTWHGLKSLISFRRHRGGKEHFHG